MYKAKFQNATLKFPDMAYGFSDYIAILLNSDNTELVNKGVRFSIVHASIQSLKSLNTECASKEVRDRIDKISLKALDYLEANIDTIMTVSKDNINDKPSQAQQGFFRAVEAFFQALKPERLTEKSHQPDS
ncbi:hypothetical protein QTN47_27160 [Danxiaibacter flavus]|uniref:CRISPR type III-B/RAMP module-associated protein Cmr5 n=1 Tax=Danxiaibacter flavus TaxID=3049108 RepID=A0ABV3ZQK1_9BACT|nr:hypothetical protein QNM32_27160 [Chitinophagaceae bacterium DXS]